MRRRDGKGKGVVEAREGESFKRANKRQENDRRAIEAILTQNPNAGVRIGAPLRPANSISASSPCSPRASSQAPCVAPSRAPSTAPSQTQSTAPSQTQSTDLSRASSRAPSAPSRVASPSASSRAPSAPSQQGNHPPQKKKRGPTKLQTFAVQTRQVIHFNDKGQPIGENSKKFSSFLGALGRDMVRITIPEWHHVSTERKEELWKLVKLRFEGLIEEHMENTLQHIGYLWKCSKSRLRTKIKIAHEKGWSDDKINSDLKLKNDRFSDRLAFRKEAESSTCIVKSNKYKELRSKNKLAHTMSRKGYARLEEEMRVRSGGVDVTRADLWIEAHKNKKGRPHSDKIARVVEKINECQMRSSTSTSQSINKDPIAQVFGPEHQGRVRGLGFGVTPTSVRATTQSSILIRKLQGDFQRLEEKHEQLAELVRSQQMPPSSRRTKQPSKFTWQEMQDI
ncbi:hypothetical protein Sjap_008210 [Stephania japonica]|uniref:Transposase n=1 Tax=Stephania japonica TaxID=461633 RepID=A0AAP0JP27_9MAGN